MEISRKDQITLNRNLLAAAEFNGPDAESIILKALAGGADPNARDEFARTALMRAVQFQSVGAVRALLTACDPEAKDDEGNTVLLVAAQCKEPLIWEMLVERCDPNVRDKLGSTPLLATAGWANPYGIKALIPVSDVAARDSQGRNALAALRPQARWGEWWIADPLKLLAPLFPDDCGCRRSPNDPESFLDQMWSENHDMLAETLLAALSVDEFSRSMRILWVDSGPEALAKRLPTAFQRWDAISQQKALSDEVAAVEANASAAKDQGQGAPRRSTSLRV